MLINEAGLVRAIKRAYKHGGYVVANLGTPWPWERLNGL